MTRWMRMGTGKQLDVVQTSKYPPGMKTQAKLDVAITYLITEQLGEMVVDKRNTQQDKRQTKFE